MENVQESEWRYQRLLERCGESIEPLAEPPVLLDEEKKKEEKHKEEEERGVPFFRAATATAVQRVVAQERAARDAARKVREDPMTRVAQCLGDDSFLHPRPEKEAEHSHPVVKHHHHKHKHKHKHRHKHDKELKALRAERLAREERERARAELLLQQEGVGR